MSFLFLSLTNRPVRPCSDMSPLHMMLLATIYAGTRSSSCRVILLTFKEEIWVDYLMRERERERERERNYNNSN